MHPSLPVRLVVSLVAALTLGACGDDQAPEPAAPAGTLRGDLTIFAAASLTNAFGEAAVVLERANPGLRVTFNFASSSTLAAQVDQGAPVDVYASADEVNMEKVIDAGMSASTPTVFATNTLQIIVAAGNPRNITSLADLAKPGTIYITAAPEVPIGAYAKRALDKAGVTVSPKSYEADVKAIVNKVVIGEADAGIVYATDVRAAGPKAAGVPIPEAQNVVARYPITVVKGAKNADTARAFIAWLTGPAGATLLTGYGFSTP